jgi:hypothetical protein
MGFAQGSANVSLSRLNSDLAEDEYKPSARYLMHIFKNQSLAILFCLLVTSYCREKPPSPKYLDAIYHLREIELYLVQLSRISVLKLTLIVRPIAIHR